MPIRSATAPALGYDLVRQTLAQPASLHLVASGAEGAVAASPQPSQAVNNGYPVYTATIDGLYGAGGLSSAQLTAWQYVVESNGSASSISEVAAVHFSADPETALDLASEQSASYTQALLAAMNDANARPSVATADYELRILRVPSLYVLAIWLWREDDDLLRLVRGTRGGLRADRWVTETEFLNELRALAEVRQAATDR